MNTQIPKRSDTSNLKLNLFFTESGSCFFSCLFSFLSVHAMAHLDTELVHDTMFEQHRVSIGLVEQ